MQQDLEIVPRQKDRSRAESDLHQRSEHSSSRERGIDGADYRARFGGIEVHEEVLRMDHIRHDTAVIPEEKTPRAGEDGQQQIESETHDDCSGFNQFNPRSSSQMRGRMRKHSRTLKNPGFEG